MSPARTIVFFDLDGTLVDSFEGLSNSYRHTLNAMGAPTPADPELRACVGPPLRGNLARLLATSDGGVVETAVAHFRAYYSTRGWAENRVYDGVRELLEAVRSAGRRLVIATGKPRVYAEKILAHEGLAAYFEGVIGPPLDAGRDDKAVLLAHELPARGLVAPGAPLVGDRREDVRAALANGLRPVGVTWGYGDHAELEGAGARTILGSPEEVRAHLLDEPAGLRRP